MYTDLGRPGDTFAVAGDREAVISISFIGGRCSPAVVCWASDHWVPSSNPLRGKFRH